MLILFLYTDVRILSLFDHVDCDNKLLTYLLLFLPALFVTPPQDLRFANWIAKYQFSYHTKKLTTSGW